MKKQTIHLQFLLVGIFLLTLFVSCNHQAKSDKEFEKIKNDLFKKTTDISEMPIYADPPTADYEDVKNGIFLFQIDSIEIANINKYRNELEPFIIQRIDSGYCWVYLAAYLKYESAVPKIKDQLLKCNQFYGWEGPDYQKVESYLVDGQYCYQMAYIAAIEYITKKTISKSISLTNEEYDFLKLNADKCNEHHIDSLTDVCYARWLLDKINRN